MCSLCAFIDMHNCLTLALSSFACARVPEQATLERVGVRGNTADLDAQPFYRFIQRTYGWHVVAMFGALFALGGLPALVWGGGGGAGWGGPKNRVGDTSPGSSTPPVTAGATRCGRPIIAALVPQQSCALEGQGCSRGCNAAPSGHHFSSRRDVLRMICNRCRRCVCVFACMCRATTRAT